MKLKRQQQGLTFLGLIIVGVLLALAGLVAAQVFPTYLEYVAVQKAVTKASAGNTVAEVRGGVVRARPAPPRGRRRRAGSAIPVPRTRGVQTPP